MAGFIYKGDRYTDVDSWFSKDLIVGAYDDEFIYKGDRYTDVDSLFSKSSIIGAYKDGFIYGGDRYVLDSWGSKDAIVGAYDNEYIYQGDRYVLDSWSSKNSIVAAYKDGFIYQGDKYVLDSWSSKDSIVGAYDGPSEGGAAAAFLLLLYDREASETGSRSDSNADSSSSESLREENAGDTNGESDSHARSSSSSGTVSGGLGCGCWTVAIIVLVIFAAIFGGPKNGPLPSSIRTTPSPSTPSSEYAVGSAMSPQQVVSSNGQISVSISSIKESVGFDVKVSIRDTGTGSEEHFDLGHLDILGQTYVSSQGNLIAIECSQSFHETDFVLFLRQINKSFRLVQDEHVTAAETFLVTAKVTTNEFHRLFISVASVSENPLSVHAILSGTYIQPKPGLREQKFFDSIPAQWIVNKAWTADGNLSSSSKVVWPSANAGTDNARIFESLSTAEADDFDRADAELNRVYKKLMNSLNPKQQEKLRDEERAWLRQLDARASVLSD